VIFPPANKGWQTTNHLFLDVGPISREAAIRDAAIRDAILYAASHFYANALKEIHLDGLSEKHLLSSLCSLVKDACGII
jgi:hypothetical protein